MVKLCGSGEVNILVFVLVVLFGAGSWIAVNGLWVELPLLVQALPEGWNLPSYLVIIIQIANIGPFGYTLARKCCKRYVNDKLCIYILVIIGAVACLLLSFVWEKTLVIAGGDRSAALFALAFFLSTVDCTSSVVFFPFMSRLKPQYLTAFFIGEGLSGMLPSLVSLAQGVVGSDACVNITVENKTTGENSTMLVPLSTPPTFSVSVFCGFLCFMMIVCGGSFVLLNYLPLAKKEHVRATPSGSPKAVIYKPQENGGGDQTVRLTEEEIQVRDNADDDESPSNLPSKPMLFYLLAMTAWVNATTNGLLPSIQSYAALPYGHTPYHLAVKLSSIVNPSTCVLLFVFPTKSKRLITALTIVGTILLSYFLFLASQSPYPPMAGTLVGSILMVVIWLINTASLSCVKVVVASILRKSGHAALLWYGISEQVGSLLGAIVGFTMVNVLHLFKSKPPCT